MRGSAKLQKAYGGMVARYRIRLLPALRPDGPIRRSPYPHKRLAIVVLDFDVGRLACLPIGDSCSTSELCWQLWIFSLIFSVLVLCLLLLGLLLLIVLALLLLPLLRLLLALLGLLLIALLLLLVPLLLVGLLLLLVGLLLIGLLLLLIAGRVLTISCVFLTSLILLLRRHDDSFQGWCMAGSPRIHRTPRASRIPG